MWSNPQFRADLVTFTEEILNTKLHFFVQSKVNAQIKVDLIFTHSVTQISTAPITDYLNKRDTFGLLWICNDTWKTFH